MNWPISSKPFEKEGCHLNTKEKMYRLLYYVYSRTASQGIVNQKVEPTPSTESAPTAPPCASTKALQIESPNPILYLKVFNCTKR